jgi:hypothetical protein
MCAAFWRSSANDLRLAVKLGSEAMAITPDSMAQGLSLISRRSRCRSAAGSSLRAANAFAVLQRRPLTNHRAVRQREQLRCVGSTCLPVDFSVNRQTGFQCARFSRAEIEGAAVRPATTLVFIALWCLPPAIYPLSRAGALVVQMLAIPISTVIRRGNQPRNSPQTFGKCAPAASRMSCAGSVPGHQLRALGVPDGLKKRKCVQMMELHGEPFESRLCGCRHIPGAGRSRSPWATRQRM